MTRSWFSAALSYAITFSGVSKVQVFERYLKSCLKVILVMESSGKIWIAFDISHPDYYFTTVRSLHSDLHVSSLSLSPGSLPWLYWLFSFYVICLSSFFSSLFCPYSPFPVCLTIISVLPFPIHVKPIELTYIASTTRFASNKKKKKSECSKPKVFILTWQVLGYFVF